MREVLNYPQIDIQKLDMVKKIIDRIADKYNGDCSGDLSELNRITGKLHTATEFVEYWGWTDLDSLAEKTLLAEPPCIRDLSKDDMREIIAIIRASIISLDDNKAEYYMELLHKSLPLYNVQEYIRMEDNDETIANNILLILLEHRLYDTSSKEITFDEFHNALKRISDITLLLQRFEDKQEAITYLVNETRLSEEECTSAYDIYIKMFDYK